jgi:hypothetical protein
MPDLTLWREKGNVKLFLAEVKGPNDRLSAEQEAHLLRLNQMGIRAIVAHVADGEKEKEKEKQEEESDSDEEEEESDFR